MEWFKRPEEMFFQLRPTSQHIVLDKQQWIDYLSRFPVAGRVFTKCAGGQFQVAIYKDTGLAKGRKKDNSGVY